MEGLHQEYGVQNYDNGVEFWFTLDTGHMPGRAQIPTQCEYSAEYEKKRQM